MIALDIRTLGLITMITAILQAGAMVTIWRLIPHEKCLKDWALGSVLIAFGNLGIALRGLIPDLLSIPVANAVQILGIGYVYLGARGLLGLSRPRPWHWLAASLVFVSFVYFGLVDPNLPVRLVLSSLAFTPYFAVCAWVYWRHGDPDLHATQKLTACIFAFGALMFLARAVVAPSANVSADYTSTSNYLIAAPYMYSLVFNVWLSITVALGVSARLQRSLMEARDRAESASVAKSQFLATMSHEIRTPLNGILGMAQLLQLSGLDEKQQKEFAGIILSSGNALLTLLNDILDLSKIEAGKMDLNVIEFAPAQLLDEVRTLLAEIAQKKGLMLDASWQGDSQLFVSGDPLRLRQMLTNLIGNGIKFTDNGFVRVNGRVLEQKGDLLELEFSVADSGIGIAEADRQHLFKNFSQVDSSPTRRFEGTGLGLAIVRSLVEKMHGSIGVDSEPGRGSRFWFTIQVGKVVLDKAIPLGDSHSNK